MQQEENNTPEVGVGEEAVVSTTNNNNEQVNTGPRVVENNIDNNVLMGVLAYLSILVIIPFMMAKDEPFVRFHIKQGLVLLTLQVITFILSWFLALMYFFALFIGIIIPLVNLGILVLAIVGIVHVIKNEQKELPIVGQFAKFFKI